MTRMNARAALGLATLTALAPTAMAQDAMERWVLRTSELDCLYVEASFREYRVPAEKDARDPANWVVKPEVCPAPEFAIWLRRPEFRIRLRQGWQAGSGIIGQHVDCSWTAGKLTTLGDLDEAQEKWLADINAGSRGGVLRVEPFLTPLEYHFFDVAADDAPRYLASRPYQVHGEVVVVAIDSAPGHTPSTARIEFDAAAGYCPKRMTLTIGADLRTQILWDLETLETTPVEGLPVITKARIFLSNPVARPRENCVYVWEVSKLEKRLMTRADLEISVPAGVPVVDLTTNKRWVAGQPGSVEDIDPEILRQMAEAAQAQLRAPAILARRQAAIGWITGGALAVALLVGALAYQVRRLQGKARS